MRWQEAALATAPDSASFARQRQRAPMLVALSGALRQSGDAVRADQVAEQARDAYRRGGIDAIPATVEAALRRRD